MINSIVNKLCSLYGSYGYRQFRMNQFEEYDFYVRNKNFLLSSNIITFNDINGKLMALKPDVTLSIIRNSKDMPDTVQKAYYNENVYRIPKGADSFREIKQVGLECFGKIDEYCLVEVLRLAAMTLKCVSEDYVLSFSSLTIITDILEKCGVTPEVKKQVMEYIGNKNTHELETLLKTENADMNQVQLLMEVSSLYGKPTKVISRLEQLLPGCPEVARLRSITNAIDNLNIEIDFSIVNDISYYNGIIFQGYINGIPESILSGGQYDKLMAELGRKSSAVGFAIYTDNLENYLINDTQKDVDGVLMYDAGCDLAGLESCRSELARDGKSILVCEKIPEGITYSEEWKYDGKGVKSIERDA